MLRQFDHSSNPQSLASSLRAALKTLGTLRRRTVRAYHLVCAREDARVRNIVVPLGVWACQACSHVSLSQWSFHRHLVEVHA